MEDPAGHRSPARLRRREKEIQVRYVWSGSEPMKFSVIVPVFRVEKYVYECLESIRRQTFEDFECIVVDDGSDDMCPQICDSFAEKDGRFKVIHKENAGVVSARKTGSIAAKGEFIICVDGDDFVDIKLLENLSELIDYHQPDIICFGANKYENSIISSFSSAVKSGVYENDNLQRIFNSYMYEPQLGGINDGRILFYIWCKCVKRELYLSCQKKIDNKIPSGEDAVFTLVLRQKVSKAVFSDYCGYFYRVNTNSVERTFNEKCFDKLDFLTNEMRRISPDMEKKIDVFYLYRALKFCLMAAQKLSYKDYMVYIKKEMNSERVSVIKNAELYNHTKASFIKCYLIQHCMWRTIYLLANTWFKGKLV